LQENPGGVRKHEGETDPLVEVSDEDAGLRKGVDHGRKRSGTAGSQSTTNSLSSRGDLIPSDEEADAVPLDDEFAMILARRTTNAASEDQSSGKASSKRPNVSRASTRTTSSKSAKSRKSSSKKSDEPSEPAVIEQVDVPAIVDLHKEEDQVHLEQEMDVEQKGNAAQELATDRGLASSGLRVHISSKAIANRADRTTIDTEI
jgi:hypothetical protein